MANEQNLTQKGKRISTERAQELARLSAESRRQKKELVKTAREFAIAALNAETTDDKGRKHIVKDAMIKKYHPLYEDKEKFIILITGGRGSGKSFNASTFIERLTFEMTPAEKIVHQILYTRYTMVSAGMSIIPEMMEKIDLDGTTKYFRFSLV